MRKQQILAVLFCSITSFSLSAMYYLLRIGYENPIAPIARTVSVSLFILCLPVICRSSKTFTDALIYLFAVVVTCAAGFVSAEWAIDLFWPLCFFGWSGFLLASWVGYREVPGKELVYVALSACALGAWLAAASWSAGYHHPLVPEMLGYGIVRRDVVFHAAVSSMIGTYNLPSTGLDGLPPLKYYWGSHLFLAGIAKLARVNALTCYQLGYPIVLFPLFFICLNTFARSLQKSAADLSLPAFCIVLFAVVLNVVPPTVLENISLESDYLYSESYNLSLSLLFLLLSFVASDVGRTAAALPAPSFFLSCLIIPLLLTLAGFTKSTVLLVTYAAGVYLFLRLKLYKSRKSVLGIFLCGASFFATSRSMNPTTAVSLSFDFPSFVKHFVAPGWGFVWLLIAFMWSWIFIALNIYVSAGNFHVKNAMAALRENRLLPAEIVGAFVVFGAAPALLFYMQGGGGIYFWDIQRWVAIGFLLGLSRTIADLFVRLKAKICSSHQVRLILPVTSIAFFCLVSAAINLTLPFVHLFSIERWLDTLMAERGSDAHFQTLELIDQLSELPLEDKRASLLYIPRSNTQYWSLHPDCTNSPFIAPAVTGIALLFGVPESRCGARYYGYEGYDPNQSSEPTRPLGRAELCEAVRRRGFSKVFILNHDRIDRSDCTV